MYIESIEIYGFKTFVNNTKIILSKGVNCIVGPNGSGKSNIVDAMRFLFGENKLSLLRVTETADLVFAGSSTREAMNTASVKVIINNEDRQLPIKTPRVIIERRLIKGSDSRYLLNGEGSSLQDVLEIFRSANIYGLTQAIVGQGRIEELLLAKPEEKKALIDRVAGIYDLRRKKEEATKKLIETEENLSKVSSLLSSVKQEYERILSESQKVHIYYALTSDLKKLEEKLFSLRIKKVRDAIKLYESGIEEKTKEENEIITKSLKVKETFEGTHKQYTALNEALAILNKNREEHILKRAKLETEIESLRSVIELKQNELEEDRLRIEKLNKTKAYIKDDIEKLRGEFKEFSDKLTALNGKKSSLEELISQKQKELAPIETAYANFKKEFEEKESKRITLEKKISVLEKEAEFRRKKIDELKAQADILSKLEVKNVDEITSKLNLLTEKTTDDEEKLKKFESDLAVLNFRVGELKMSLDASRLPSFKEGSLGNILKIDKNLFGLKEYLEGVVVKDIKEINERKERRFFIEFDSNTPDEIPDLKPISSLLNVSSPFFYGIYVADTLDIGIKSFRNYFRTHYIREIITLDGFVLLSPYEVEKWKGLNIDEEKEYEKLLEQKRLLYENITALKKKIETDKITEKNLNEELLKAKEVERKVSERKTIEEEIARNTEELNRYTEMLDAAKAELKLQFANTGFFDDSELNTKKGEIASLKDELSKVLLMIKEVEMNSMNYKKDLEEKNRRIVSIENEVKEVENKNTALTKEIEENEEKLNKDISELNSVELVIADIDSSIKETNKQLEDFKKKEDELNVHIEQLNDLKSGVHESIERIRLNLTKEEANLENLLSALKERSLSEIDVNPNLNEDSLKNDISKLKVEIEQLEPLDFTSIDKENEAKTNYEERKAVYDDVYTAKKELEKYVGELERTIKTKFDNTFEALKVHFQNIFIDIFSQGEATLEKIFDDTEEITGVEISVRLPFKKKQPLSVLSGGEKTLVALAFLFAIFEINPSPFYILDEVDAALDDENVYKFGNLIEKFSEKSQFLIITHNKQTMEKADILYGITMEEDGLSKVVSLKLV